MLLVVLVYPILEELAFRGAIQSWLLEKPKLTRFLVWRVSVANVVTSLLFALAHLYNQPPVWAAAVFFPSLVFGYFRERCDGLAVPVVLHIWYNLGFVLLFVR